MELLRLANGSHQQGKVEQLLNDNETRVYNSPLLVCFCVRRGAQKHLVKKTRMSRTMRTVIISTSEFAGSVAFVPVVDWLLLFVFVILLCDVCLLLQRKVSSIRAKGEGGWGTRGEARERQSTQETPRPTARRIGVRLQRLSPWPPCWECLSERARCCVGAFVLLFAPLRQL